MYAPWGNCDDDMMHNRSIQCTNNTDGKVVAAEDDLDGSMKGKLPNDWWENRAILDNENLTVQDGRLLNRMETPFALVNIDDYEVIR